MRSEKAKFLISIIVLLTALVSIVAFLFYVLFSNVKTSTKHIAIALTVLKIVLIKSIFFRRNKLYRSIMETSFILFQTFFLPFYSLLFFNFFCGYWWCYRLLTLRWITLTLKLWSLSFSLIVRILHHLFKHAFILRINLLVSKRLVIIFWSIIFLLLPMFKLFRLF